MDVFRRGRRDDCEVCKRVLTRARVLVTPLSITVRRDLEITCYTDHFSVVFLSGEGQHKIVVQVDDENRVLDYKDIRESYMPMEAITGAISRNWRPFVAECLDVAACELSESVDWKCKIAGCLLRTLAKNVVHG